jgi:hypothetical protein
MKEKRGYMHRSPRQRGEARNCSVIPSGGSTKERDRRSSKGKKKPKDRDIPVNPGLSISMDC